MHPRGLNTHRITIEEFGETGETEDDGMGGTVPVEDWQDVAEFIGRYSPRGDGLVREDWGARVYREPHIICPFPDKVGLIDTETGAYEPAVEAGDDWRVTVEGVTGTFSIVDVRPRATTGQVPTHVMIEVELTS